MRIRYTAPMLQTEFWQNLTTHDFAGLDAERVVALLPVGAIEQHGPHLPLGTDALIAEALSRAVMERVPNDLLVMPTLSIGHSLEHLDYAGTLSIAAEPLLACWLEAGRGVARAGIRKLLILNAHGGNTPLVQLAALRLRQELGLLVARGNYFAFGHPPGLFEQDELRHGFHGGEVETSLMLHLHPDLVRRELAPTVESLAHRLGRDHRQLGVEKPMGFGWMSQDLDASGVSGDAASADAERGATLFTHLTTCLTELIGELQAMPWPLSGQSVTQR